METEQATLTYLQKYEKKWKPMEKWDVKIFKKKYPNLIIYNEDIKEAIKNTKNRSPGNSGIKQPTLANLPDNLVEALTNLANAILTIGYWPKKFKHTILIPIPKPGKTPTPNNFRPISLLEIPSKIIERIYTNKTHLHLSKNKLYNKDQYGFLPQRGTEVPISLFTENIYKKLREGKDIYIAFRDIASAFDRLWKPGLVYKQCKNKIPPPLIKQSNSSLENRTFEIQLKNSRSTIGTMETGVSQGSISAPQKYIIYTQDAPPADVGCNQYTYADDNTHLIAIKSRHRSHIANLTTKEINRMNDYEYKWKIKTNKDKFKLISLTHKYSYPVYSGHGNKKKRLQFHGEGTFLGLTINRAGYTKHINNRIYLAKMTLKSLYRFRELPTKTKKTLYLTLVRSKLIYPIAPLASANITNIKKMQRIQNAGIKFILKYDWQEHKTMQQLHEEINIKPINIEIYERNIKIWRKIEALYPKQYKTLKKTNTHCKKYKKFGSSLHEAIKEPPIPIYT